MPRGLSQALLNEIAKSTVFPALIADLDTSLGAVRVWSGIGNLVFGGNTYTGVGELGRINVAPETEEVRANATVFELSGIPSSLISTALGADYMNRPAKLWLAFLDATGTVIDSILLFSGKMDFMRIEEGPETATISVTAESELADLDRPRVRRYTDQDQQELFPGDRGLEFVTSLQDKEISWKDGEDLHLVVALAGHECNAIKEVYFNDELAFDAAGNVQPKFQGWATLAKHLGADDQTADTGLMAAVPEWTSSHRLRGICYVYVKLKFNRDIFPSIPNITCVVEGEKCFDPRDGQTKFTDNAALAIAKYFNDSRFGLNAAYGTKINNTALAAAANKCDELVSIPQRDTGLITINVTASSGKFTRPSGSFLADGFAPGMTITPSGFANAGNNTTRTIARLTDTEIIVTDATGLVSETGSGDERIVSSSTEKRYTLNGIIDSSATPRENIEKMLTAMAGTAVYVGGTWNLDAGAFNAATITLDESDLRSEISCQATLPRRDLANAIRGVFTSRSDNYIAKDFPPLKSSVFQAQDNGEIIWRDIELPFTVTETMAERLARIELFAIREQISVSAMWGLRALDLRVGDTVNLTIARFGWTNKPFRVTKWNFAIRDQNGAPELVIAMDLRETSSAVYDVAATDQQLLAAAPDTELMPPAAIDVDTISSLPPVELAPLLGNQFSFAGFSTIIGPEQSPAWTGTTIGLVRNPLTGHLVVDDQLTASGDNFNVFDEFVQDPVVSASYETPEISISFDDLVRTTAALDVIGGPGESGSFKARVEFDSRMDAGTYDGFDPLGAGQSTTARHFKYKIVFDASGDKGFIVRGFRPLVGKKQIVQGEESRTVAIGGTTITFATPYHNTPRILAAPIGTAPRMAVIESPTRTQFTLKLFDANGNDVGGIATWRAEGV